MALLPRVGDLFGRYRIDAQIGRGGMGVVYSATDTTIERRVALKVVAAALGDSSEFRARFEREAAVLARLDSPHVIAIYDYGTHDGCPYIATQYVGGGDLGALLHQRGPMPTALALRLCAQVADALHDAHRVGVVHRDVKPTNVLLRDADSLEPHAYLCDFGIARTATDGLTAPGAVAGTWSYLSPECGRGAPGTPASDVYALGCLLWATLTGSPPYRGSDVEIAVAHQRAPIPQLTATDELGTRINQILQRSLAKDPAGRYDTADQLRVDLLAAAGLPGSGVRAAVVAPDQLPTLPPGAPGSGPPGHLSLGSLPPRSSPPTPAPARRTRRRSSVLIAAVCAGVVAVAGGVLAATQLGGDDGDPGAGPGTSTTSAPTSAPPTSGSTEPPVDPTDTRRDAGGPITGDLDGDGIGEVDVEFLHTVVKRGGRTDSFTDRTTWTSDGRRLEQGKTVRLGADDPSKSFERDYVGDFDGDDRLESIVVRSFEDKERRLQIVGDLSGGTRVDTTLDREPLLMYFAVIDHDADGADDLLFHYYDDFEVAPVTFGVLVLEKGEFTAPRTVAVVPDSMADITVEAGDLDGDGYGDLVVQRFLGYTADVDIRLEISTLMGGPGRSRPGPSVRFAMSSRPTLLTGDVDGDEDDEIVLDDQSLNGTLSVVDLRDGRLRRPVSAGSIPTAGKTANTTGIRDVNGDGLDDVVAISKVSDKRVQLLVATSDKRRFVGGGRWATWERDFKTSKYFYDLSVSGQGFQ